MLIVAALLLMLATGFVATLAFSLLMLATESALRATKWLAAHSAGIKVYLLR